VEAATVDHDRKLKAFFVFLSEHEFIFVYLNVPFATPVKKCFKFPVMINCRYFHDISFTVYDNIVSKGILQM
jgi:hypothetical protein